MTTSLRDVLTAVREGRLEPAEAATLLDRGEPAETPAPAMRAEAAEHPGPAATVDPDGPTTTACEAAGTEAAGTEAAGTEGNDSEAGGTEGNDSEAAGTEAAGTEAAPEAAGARKAGADEPGAEAAGTWADAVDDPSESAAGGSADGDLRAPREPADRPPAGGTPRAVSIPNGEPGATTSLRLRAMTRRVRVLADPSVTTVSVDGPHDLRREGATLILESDRDLPFGDPFAFLPAMRGGFRLQPSHGFPLSFGSDLVVRLNPAIALDIDVTAGSLQVRGLSRVRARVTAGSARIEDMDGPLDLHVVGGTAKVDMTARGRENRIRCESGSITLRLRKDSDVRLRPDAQLGRISIDGVEGGREIVVGAGTGRLDVEIVMGNLQVEVEP